MNINQQIDAMAIRCGCLPREEYRKKAFAQDWRKGKSYSVEELAVRQTGRTTTTLLAALCAADTGRVVFLRGLTKEATLFMRDDARRMAREAGINPQLFQVDRQASLFEDHTVRELP